MRLPDIMYAISMSMSNLSLFGLLCMLYLLLSERKRERESSGCGGGRSVVATEYEERNTADVVSVSQLK